MIAASACLGCSVEAGLWRGRVNRVLIAGAGSTWSIVTVFSVARAGTGAALEAAAGSWRSQIFLELHKFRIQKIQS